MSDGVERVLFYYFPLLSLLPSPSTLLPPSPRPLFLSLRYKLASAYFGALILLYTNYPGRPMLSNLPNHLLKRATATATYLPTYLHSSRISS